MTQFICAKISEHEKTCLTNQSDRNSIIYFSEELLNNNFENIPPPVLKLFKSLNIVKRSGNYRNKGSVNMLSDYGRKLIDEVIGGGS